ncbi:MAG: IS1249 family transposase [Actinobacteria bacterium]|nr:IS1249 family transposase [Actinomycetota bacterium]
MKNGRTAAGTQRWRCKNCGASRIKKRGDVTRRHQLTRFLTWLTGKHAQTDTRSTSAARQFRRDTAWCWNIEPRLGPVTTTHHTILIDGIYIGSWCLLIAVTESLHVLAWQWCARESTAAWAALISRIPAPVVAVCDGGAGIAAALRQEWPTSRVQRCLFHVRMNLRRHLTLNPRTEAGKHLARIGRALSEVTTIEDAIQWQKLLNIWWQAYGKLTPERTRYRDGSWGYTHDRLRKAWQLLHSLTRKQVLFTYLEHGNARTTSPLEGGINNGIRTVLRNHRGMSEAHMKRAAEWFLTLREIPLDRAHELINTSTPGPIRTATVPEDDTQGPALYDTGLDAGEGLWLRAGWAGRG